MEHVKLATEPWGMLYYGVSGPLTETGLKTPSWSVFGRIFSGQFVLGKSCVTSISWGLLRMLSLAGTVSVNLISRTSSNAVLFFNALIFSCSILLAVLNTSKTQLNQSSRSQTHY